MRKSIPPVTDIKEIEPEIKKLDIEMVVFTLAATMPGVFARHEIGKLTGGLLNPKSLANIQSDRTVEGPPYLKAGKIVGFERTSFLNWLRESGRIKVHN